MSQYNTLDCANSIHFWKRCSGCGERPLKGRRFECQSCPIGPDNDLCEDCYQGFLKGTIKHPIAGGHAEFFVKDHHDFQAFEGEPQKRIEPWFSAIPKYDLPPALPNGFLVRPEFCSKRESFFGSYAFLVRLDSGEAVVLTALHVMDELLKCYNIDCSQKNNCYTGREIPAILAKVVLYDICSVNWMGAELGSADSMLIIPGARTGDDEPNSYRDLAAFSVQGAIAGSPPKLATSTPTIGDSLWLVIKGQGRSARREIAVVVDSTEKTLVYRFDTRSELPRNTSGAPLVNKMGEVVGINVGGAVANGKQFGHGAHVMSIRRHLETAPSSPEFYERSAGERH